MGYKAFSVAISVYKNDNPSFFDRALESITVAQTIKPDEIVLVVDGPVPQEIDDVINKYTKNYNFKVIRFEQNQGLGTALKIATENCTNNLIARMDSDDVAVNDRFEQQLRFFENNPNIDILGGDISEFIDSEDDIISYRTVPTTDKDLKEYTKNRCPFNHMTVMYKKTSIMNAGGYLDWHYNEDYYLWIRMYLSGAVFANTGTTLVNVRTGKEQFARRGGRKYYKSEKGLQKYMFDHKMISRFKYFTNCCKRFIVQVLMPNKVRGFVLQKMARSKK